MAESKNSTALEEITPEERQWRLSQVYGLLIAVAQQKRAGQQQHAEPVQAASTSASMAN